MKLDIEPSAALAGPEAREAADHVLDEMWDHDLAARLRQGSTRRDFAGCAARISEDRYNGGSTAALATIYIMLAHGVQTALDFQADLSHHEG